MKKYFLKKTKIIIVFFKMKEICLKNLEMYRMKDEILNERGVFILI